MTILASVNNKTLMPGITPIADVSDRPTIGTATAAGLAASITFTAATTGGTPTTFTATSNPGSITGTSATSPVTVSGLTGDTSYTFTVTAGNSTGTSPASASSNSITAVSPFTGGYDALASAVITSSGSIGSVSFAGIPSGYKHLQIRMSATEPTGDAYFSIVFNGDTTQTNYPRHRLYGTGSSTSAGFQNTDATTKGVIIGIPAYSTTNPSVSITDILDYNSSSKYKTVRILHGQDANGSGIIEFNSSLWLNTAAITSLDVRCNLSGGGSSGNTFNANSRISLYGVK